jgi:penicillin-binding protein 2
MELFPWKEDGGLRQTVNLEVNQLVDTEALYADELTRIKDRPLFTGRVIPLKRFKILSTALVLIFAVLAVKAFWMQVVQGEEYRALAEQNRLRHEVVMSRRGVIRDQQSRVLAENIPTFDVQATGRLLPYDSTERAQVLGKVGRIIGSTVGELEALLASSTYPFEGVVFKKDVPYEQAIALKIVTANDPGIEVAVSSKRHYIYSDGVSSLSHILGYVGLISREELKQYAAAGYRQVDNVGKTGVESSYETVLRGRPGERVLEVDARHNIMSVVGETEPIDGQDLYLTLDLDLQKAAEQALLAEMRVTGVKRAAAVVMRPENGEILALVSLPAYDNNIFSGNISREAYGELTNNPDRPFLPRAWAGTYPSGSTVKLVIALAALAEGVITPVTTVMSVGGLQIGPWFFPDWKAGGHGPTNVRQALAWSVNTFFYYIGGGYEGFIGLGLEKLIAWMQGLGLGSKTGLDVPGEVSGFVPSESWKIQTKGERWFVGDTYNLSIGQGDLLVTPLQVANFTAVIANGGHKITPHLARSSNVESRISNLETELIAPADAIQTVQRGMRDGVLYGSSRLVSIFPVPVAGKTGTAQWRNDRANHAWFTAFAPYEKPEVVVTVLLEEGGEGSSTAVPVAYEILRAWYNLRSAGKL